MLSSATYYAKGTNILSSKLWELEIGVGIWSITHTNEGLQKGSDQLVKVETSVLQ